MQTTEKIILKGKTYELINSNKNSSDICQYCAFYKTKNCDTNYLCTEIENAKKHWKEVKPQPKHTTTDKIIIAVATIIGVCYAATMVYYFIKTF